MNYWLIKSEPATWGWHDQVRDGTTHWHGVRNYQAAANLKAMQLGDRCFFYHSNEGREIVGVVEVVKLYYPDPSDPKGIFGMVDVKLVKPMKNPVTLSQIKADPRLQHLQLVTHSRLSVQSVDIEAWKYICALGGIDA